MNTVEEANLTAWREEHAKREADEARRREGAQALCAAVAESRGWQWTATAAERAHWLGNLTLPGGLVIGATLTWNHPERLELGPRHWPKTASGQECRPFRDGPKDISVSVTRTAEQIAREIERRLIPQYRVAYDEQAECARQTDAHEQQTAETLTLLVEALGPGAERREYRDGPTAVRSVSGFDFCASPRHDGDATISAHWLPLPLVLTICKAVAAYCAEHAPEGIAEG